MLEVLYTADSLTTMVTRVYQVIISPQLPELSTYSFPASYKQNGLPPNRSIGKEALPDKIVIPAKYTNVNPFSEGLAAVQVGKLFQ